MKIFLTALLVLGSVGAKAALVFEEKADLFECQAAGTEAWTFTVGSSQLESRAAIYAQKFLNGSREEIQAFDSEAVLAEHPHGATLVANALDGSSVLAEFRTTATGERQTYLYSAEVTLTNSKGVARVYSLSPCRKLY